MEETPENPPEIPDRTCCLCGYSTDLRRLCRVRKKAGFQILILDILGEDITHIDGRLLDVCRNCTVKVQKFHEFKSDATLTLIEKIKSLEEAGVIDPCGKSLVKKFSNSNSQKPVTDIGHHHYTRTNGKNCVTTVVKSEEHDIKISEVHFTTQTTNGLVVKSLPPSNSTMAKSIEEKKKTEPDENKSECDKPVTQTSRNEQVSGDHGYVKNPVNNIAIPVAHFTLKAVKGIVLTALPPSNVIEKSDEGKTSEPEKNKGFDKPFAQVSRSEQVAGDHGYGKIPINTIKEKNKEIVVKCPLLNEDEMDMIKATDVAHIFEEIINKKEIAATRLAFLLLKCPPVDVAVKQFILKEIEAKLKTKFKKNSILYSRDTSKLGPRGMFETIVLEMQENVPFLADILMLCCQGKKIKSTVSMVATIFGMIMQCRNSQLSAVQRFYTSLCTKYHSDVDEILSLLNVVHLTLDCNSKRVANDPPAANTTTKKKKMAYFSAVTTNDTVELPEDIVVQVPTEDDIDLPDLCL